MVAVFIDILFHRLKRVWLLMSTLMLEGMSRPSGSSTTSVYKGRGTWVEGRSDRPAVLSAEDAVLSSVLPSPVIVTAVGYFVFESSVVDISCEIVGSSVSVNIVLPSVYAVLLHDTAAVVSYLLLLPACLAQCITERAGYPLFS